MEKKEVRRLVVIQSRGPPSQKGACHNPTSREGEGAFIGSGSSCCALQAGPSKAPVASTIYFRASRTCRREIGQRRPLVHRPAGRPTISSSQTDRLAAVTAAAAGEEARRTLTPSPVSSPVWVVGCFCWTTPRVDANARRLQQVRRHRGL